jgi:hypothetical protein
MVTPADGRPCRGSRPGELRAAAARAARPGHHPRAAPVRETRGFRRFTRPSGPREPPGRSQGERCSFGETFRLSRRVTVAGRWPSPHPPSPWPPADTEPRGFGAAGAGRSRSSGRRAAIGHPIVRTTRGLRTSSEHPLRPGRSRRWTRRSLGREAASHGIRLSPLHRRAVVQPLRGHRLAPAPGVPRGHLGTCSVLVVSHHLDGLLHTTVAGLLHPAADPGVRRVVTRDAVRTLRRIPLASSRTLSPGPLPPRGSVAARPRSQLRAAGRVRTTPPGWAPVRRSRPPHTTGDTRARPPLPAGARRGAGHLEALLRRRIRSVVPPLPAEDALSFHGLGSPSRSSGPRTAPVR